MPQMSLSHSLKENSDSEKGKKLASLKTTVLANGTGNGAKVHLSFTDHQEDVFSVISTG